MRRKVFDRLASAGGVVVVVILVVVVVILVVAGFLLLWGYSFANSNVHDQLAEQEIYFPTAAAFTHAEPGTEVTRG